MDESKYEGDEGPSNLPGLYKLSKDTVHVV